MTGSADRWRMLSTGTGNACFNMALDELLAGACADGAAPVFRVYGWAAPAITIGYAQRPAEFLDIAACESAGVEVTRRLTGGRALFHTNEIAYTVIGRIDDPVFGGRIVDTYRTINRVIAQAFERCGIDDVTEQQPAVARIPAALRRGAPCFASPTRHELALNGMKVSGGAQRRFNGIFLQQGSVRLGPGAERIADFLLDREAAAGYRQALIPGDQAGTESLILPERFTGALIASFPAIAGGAAEPGTLTIKERQTAEELGETRYRAKGWIYGDRSVDL